MHLLLVERRHTLKWNQPYLWSYHSWDFGFRLFACWRHKTSENHAWKHDGYKDASIRLLRVYLFPDPRINMPGLAQWNTQYIKLLTLKTFEFAECKVMTYWVDNTTACALWMTQITRASDGWRTDMQQHPLEKYYPHSWQVCCNKLIIIMHAANQQCVHIRYFICLKVC